MKKKKFLIVILILCGMFFGVNAQNIPCMKEVRCSKLDSAQHDIEELKAIKIELVSLNNIFFEQKAIIKSLDSTINSYEDELSEKEAMLEKLQKKNDIKDITIAENNIKIKRRGQQRNGFAVLFIGLLFLL